MKWISIKNSDLESALNKPQLDVLKAAALSSPNKDAAADIISSITTRIRAEVAACEKNTLDPDHSTIPPELKECALSLILEALVARIPSMKFGDAIEKRAIYARETLVKVACCELPVTRPVGGIRVSGKKGISICHTRGNRISRTSMEGL